MGFLDFLSGAGQIGGFQGVDINKNDFQIKNADALYGQTQSQYNQAAAQQSNINQKSSDFLNQLQQSAAGQGPSLSMATLKAAQDQSLAQQLAAVQAQRGTNAGATQRELLRAGSASSAANAQTAAQSTIQEQNANKQLYSGELNNQRTSVAQGTQNYLQQGFTIEQAQEQALADYNHLNVQQSLGLATTNAAQQQALAQQQNAGVGRIMGIGSMALGGAGLLGGGGSTGALPTGGAISTGGTSGFQTPSFLQAVSSKQMMS